MTNRLTPSSAINLFHVRVCRQVLVLPDDAALVDDCNLVERAITTSDLNVNEARRVPAARERIARFLRDRD